MHQTSAYPEPPTSRVSSGCGESLLKGCYEVRTDTSADGDAGSSSTSPWRPGRFHNVPWKGVTGLFVTLLTVGAVVTALLSANNKDIHQWPTEKMPISLTVVLAVLTAVGNAGLGLAYKEGVTVLWWIKMLKGGTLESSHRYWEHGSNVFKAAIHWRSFSKMSLASIVMVLLLVEGPLLQRSVNINTVTLEERVELRTALSTDQLSQPTSYYMTKGSLTTVTANFARVIKDYGDRSPTTVHPVMGCKGICSTTLVAAGFDVSCRTSTKPYDLTSMAGGDNATVGKIVINTHGLTEPAIINVLTMHKPEPTAKGNLVVNECALHVGRVRYPVQVTNETIMLLPFDATLNYTVGLDYPSRETIGPDPSPCLLGGITSFAAQLYEGDLVLYRSGTLALMGGPMSYMFMTSNQSMLGEAGMTWSDPMPSVVQAIREMTFRTAVAFSNGSYLQSTPGIQQRTVTKYAIQNGFLAGALLVTIVTALSVAWLFHGYWLFGRKVSMSPLELAKAFQAPITFGAESNADVDKLVDQIGGRPVQYGALQPKEQYVWATQKLGVASPFQVLWPAKE